jgi:uncharacterized protein (DUF2384 family)
MAVARKPGALAKASGSPTTKREAATGRFVEASPLGAPLIGRFIETSGRVAIERVADSFGMSKGQLAETVGLGRETFHKATRMNAAKTQSRVREMLEIVSRVSEWAGGKDQAMAWYRAQPISAFGGRTAESLVKAGEAGPLRDYLDHLATGGFA